jgi:protein ImuB
MKRVMCLRLPNWPVQWRYVAHVARPLGKDRAIVVSAPDRGKDRVVACCRVARKRGVRVGMLLAEAQSLWPGSAEKAVRFENHDPHGDRDKLRELAGWAGQYSPYVAIDDAESPDCLLVDVTGCDYFAGGERGLAEKAVNGLRMKGYWAFAAIADTIGAAWAVAHSGVRKGAEIVVVPPWRHEEALRPLPVETLRLSRRVADQLHEVKVVRIDQLLVLPRESLPSRFGPELLTRLDQALGHLPEVLKPEKPTEPLETHWDFELPVEDQQTVLAVFEHLLERLLKKIPRDRLGVHRMLITLKLADYGPKHFPVDLLRPTASQRDLMDLLRLQLERLRIPGEVEGIVVRIAALASLEFRQADLFGGGRLENGDEATRLIERLSSRLGPQAVLRPRLVPDAQPEFAYEYDPWLAATRSLRSGARDLAQPGSRSRFPKRGRPALRSEDSASRLTAMTRPIHLLSPQAVEVVSVYPGGSPRRLFWDDRDHMVKRAWGPERIETGWWRGGDVRRDYFVVETAAGERLWLFRDLADGSWFLHGVFA